MTKIKKQLKITKLFRRSGAVSKNNEDCDDLEEEVRQLQRQLLEKQHELFKIRRDAYRHPLAPIKHKGSNFVRPQRIILDNAIETLKREMELCSMISGTEVKSYVAGEHCCVVFHMQHPSKHAISHGLRIEMTSGTNEIASMSLPVGFNLATVMDEFDSVMNPECLRAIQKALVAYYERLQQYDRLKILLNIEAELFKTLDGSHMEIAMFVRGADFTEEDNHIPVTLMLDYRIYDIRPKSYSIKEIDLPEGVADVLKEQCAIFKNKTLAKAFKEAFLSDITPYKLVQQLRPIRPTQQRRKKRIQRANPHNDDTFRPEDCSDSGSDEYVDAE